MKKVAIWGSLNYGNFGDDVMNVIFGVHMKKQGYRPVLYRLDEDLASQNGLESAPDLEQLLAGAEYCFIGGGSWLESRRLGETYEKDFYDLKEKLEEKNIPLYVISIGGDINSTFDNLTEDRQKLFSSGNFKGGTVRLDYNKGFLNDLGKEVKYYPDIVLLSSDYFLEKAEKKRNGKFRIGLSVNDIAETRILVEMFEKNWFRYRNYELVFMNTHLPKYNKKYEYEYKGKCSRIKNEQYSDLHSFYQFLSGLDVVICSKLHPGVAALSCGVPYIWIGKLGKTRSFMESVQLQDFCLSYPEVIDLISRKKIKQKIQNYSFAEIQKQRKEAEGHLQFLSQIDVTKWQIKY